MEASVGVHEPRPLYGDRPELGSGPRLHMHNSVTTALPVRSSPELCGVTLDVTRSWVHMPCCSQALSCAALARCAHAGGRCPFCRAALPAVDATTTLAECCPLALAMHASLPPLYGPLLLAVFLARLRAAPTLRAALVTKLVDRVCFTPDQFAFVKTQPPAAVKALALVSALTVLRLWLQVLPGAPLSVAPSQSCLTLHPRVSVSLSVSVCVCVPV